MIKSDSDSHIKEVLLERSLTSNQKIQILKDILHEENTINPDKVKLIAKLLKGTYGSEYSVIQEDEQTIIEFYKFLDKKFPKIHQVKLYLADLLLNQQCNDSLNMFIQLFVEALLLIFEAPGELTDILEKHGSEQQKVFYYLSLVRAFIEDKNFEDALEQYQEIIQRYGNNKDVLDYIEKSNLLSLLESDKIKFIAG